ncbi:MAG: glycosyltransferase, partial [Lachnospiraceae bacterium]|nr:glycosyltransferase [Lachnospiraceae bacterium]
MEFKKAVRQQLEKLFDMRYRRKRKRYIQDYGAWVKELEQVVEKDGLQDTAQEKEGKGKAAQTSPEVVLLAFAGGCWSKDAQARMNRFFAENPEVLLAYGDEDIIVKKNVFSTPWLKPCWSPDSYLCRDYLGSAVAVRRSLFEQLTEEECQDEGLCHDRLAALAGGFQKGCRTIAHVNGIFYHRLEKWRLPDEGRSEKQIPPQEAAGLVSVIIPSKDNVSVLKQCLETLCRTVKETVYEIIVVDNGSSVQSREAVGREIDRLNREAAYREHLQRAVYLYKPMEFNFSRMCNLGAEEAKGNLLLFLNDDIEAVEAGWLEAMVQKAMQPWAGAVGYKLLYPDSERIQHAGVTNIALGPT